MANILVAFDTVDEGFERLVSQHKLIRPPKGKDFSQEELAELLPEADILCSVFNIPIGEQLLSCGTKLQMVINYAVGYNNIDLNYCKSRGICVCNLPKSVVIPTAELAMALLLSCTRRVVELDNLIRTKEGKRLGIGRLGMMGLDLYGKTIGIIGFGNIGAAVAERCRAFGMKVLYNKRNRLSIEEETERGIEYASFDDLLRRSDVISVHTPYSAETHHQIDAGAFGLMKQGAIFINTSRGAIVDENALIEALEGQHIAGAGLDVFEDADIPRAKLLQMPQVVMTPHVGTQTYDARMDMVNEMVDNVLGFIAGRRDISRVI